MHAHGTWWRAAGVVHSFRDLALTLSPSLSLITSHWKSSKEYSKLVGSVMANSNQGNSDGRFTTGWIHSHNPSLPPKSPSLTPDAAPFPFSGATSSAAPLPRSGSQKQQQHQHHHHHHHQRTPSASIIIPQPPFSWIDDMLDSPEAPAARGKILHRRSASDTAAFLDFPMGLESSSSRALPDDQHLLRSREEDFSTYTRNVLSSTGSRAAPCDFERLDDEQIMSMFGESDSFQQRSITGTRSGTATPSNNNNNHVQEMVTNDQFPTSPSESNSGNEMSVEDVKPGAPSSSSCPKLEADEVQSINTSPRELNMSPGVLSGAGVRGSSKQPTASSHIDPNMDPKRAKRILANRQSAQRSRVRKLQYIAELERSVTALQTEVSSLTPQVSYLDHQRILLGVDNNSIKQRIGSLMQDKLFKDAHNESMTREVHRLRQLLQQQDELRSQLHFGSEAAGEPGAKQQQDHFNTPFQAVKAENGVGTSDSQPGSTNGLLEHHQPDGTVEDGNRAEQSLS